MVLAEKGVVKQRETSERSESWAFRVGGCRHKRLENLVDCITILGVDLCRLQESDVEGEITFGYLIGDDAAGDRAVAVVKSLEKDAVA